MKRMAFCLVWALVQVSTTAAGEVGFVEDFALAKDRTESLKKLIPGTEDYYYYHALHYLNTEQYEKAEGLNKPWLERFGQTARLTEIQTRHALLTYERNPQRSLEYLRSRLNLHFDHQRVITGGVPNLATVLDQKLIDRSTLRADSFARWKNLDNFEDSALDWLAYEKLDGERRRHLLQRLQRPDIAGLAKLVADDLTAEHSPGFGAFPVHQQMTLPQLDDLLKLRPELLTHGSFVNTMLTKLQPGADEDWRRDPALTRAYLDRLLAFVRRLAPSHNALNAHVLYHRLLLDRAAGIHNHDIFLEYLKLPRQQPYMSKTLLEAESSRRFPADLNANFTGVTLLAPVHTDEPVVRAYLKHFFLAADTAKEFEPFINDVYLQHLFAETKIENGLGDAERWASLLPPELFRQLKDRIDIDFAPTNKTAFAAGEPVTLDLHVKNVPTLIVKVFEINTLNFYREHKREVDTDITLDGLIANTETTHSYNEPTLRRVARKFEFPQLNKPGVYVVDFIGAGKSSRALVRKGRLRPLVAIGTAGQSVTVLDDANQMVKDATLWLNGQEYKADADGTITVPFSTSPGQQPIVLSKGDLASLDHLQHQAENYSLTAGIHVDREALLSQRLASLLIRPALYLNGQPVSVKLLEEVKLKMTATDHDGIATASEVPDFKLFEDRESVHEFRVPPRLASLQVALVAKVKSLSQNKSVDLAAGEVFALNGIDKTDKIDDLHLAQFGPDHVLELLGRTGEPRPDRPVQLALKHRDFRQPINATLKTDALGRINLGALKDIVSVNETGPDGAPHTFWLPSDHHSYRQVVHAKFGEVIALPYLGSANAASRDELALFEMRGTTIQGDQFDALSIRDGMIEIKGLPAGDFDLWLKRSGERIRLRVVDGDVLAGHVLGKLRHLQLPLLKPVQIAAITADADGVTIRLRDASPFTRVHVYGTRYEPAYSAFADLGKVRDAELQGMFPAHAESVYLAGRNIGDEYRYVLDRRYQKKFPGNMLERPALLLNPWVIRSTETSEQLAQMGDDFGAAGEPKSAKPYPAEDAAAQGRGPGSIDPKLSANLDFLAEAAAVIVNLVPDKNGVVKVPRKQLGSHAMIHVVAVDPLNTTYRSTTLPEQQAKVYDLRLRVGLDPQGHFTQQKQVTVLPAAQPFVLADAAGSRFEVYDSLAKVYALYATLSKDPKLAEFAFVLNWPTLKPEEKRKQYSKYASHELNFFLSKKDPEFFRNVVCPLLVNKKDKTFLDRWFLSEELKEFLNPWQFERLNSVERILLAQRMAGERARTSRHLTDLFRLLPPNPDRTRMLFETAVKRGSMDKALMLMMRGFNDVDGIVQPKSGITLGPTDHKSPVMPAMPPPAAFRAGDIAGERVEEKKMADKVTDAPMKKEAERAGKSGGIKDQKKAELVELADQDKRLGARAYFKNDRGEKLARQLYRRLDPTEELAENNYYHLTIQQQLAGLVPVSEFWLDYAKHDGKGPFLSRNLADASRNFTEMMMALAVLDLPFSAGKHDVKFDAGKMTFTPAGTLIAFHEEVRAVARGANAAPLANAQILVSQNFYRHGDRFRDENGERYDKFISGEFVVQTVYGCQVVVTNPSPSRQRLSVLVQLPVGSMPLANGQPTKTVLLDLEPYRTQTIDYLFYFPKAGHFTHFPVHVAKNETLVAAATPAVFDVVDKPSKLDTGSWEYVSQNGTSEQVLAFLDRENVHALDLNKIAFRMRDKEFFSAATLLLQQRHAYHPTLWSYGLYHNALPALREFLLHADQIVAECGGPIVCTLLTIDPVARHQYEHFEYKPLVNARTHLLGQRRQIVNGPLYEQYHRFMKLLGYRKQLADDDQLAVAYYLLLQDRIEEALAMFAQVNADKVVTKLQYDYCAAYLDLYADEPGKARAIANRYATHPVDRWRNAFASIGHQLDEIDGKGPKVADAEDRTQRQGGLAASEPGFEFTLDGKTVNLAWQNLDAARVNYYLMDVELLFSRNPFVQQSGGQFSSIRPNAVRELKLPAGQTKLALKLPDDLARRNVLVEITAAGKTRSLPYYANAMDVRLTENYGQLRVTDSAGGKALPKVYVKSYIRLANGQVKFHKDGYTDHRGRFDYATVSTPENVPPDRFAILVLSDEYGAMIREAAPPQQ